jgi:RNA polymerase sigma factor (TIGR02999 family)
MEAPRTRIRVPGEHAVDQLFPILYDALRVLAHRQRGRWRDDHTLNTTALLHEAYVKLAGQARVEVDSQDHFLALAATAMRHILCNYARDRHALKRGGGLERVSFEEGAVPASAAADDDGSDTLISLDDALKRLEQLDPRQGRVVECRFFGGMSVEETASAIGISPRTVKRDWAVAQAWLHREMTGGA